MISRRLGPEPILLALLTWFVTGGTAARVAVLFILPWTHATGPLLGAGALLWLFVDERSLRGVSIRKCLPAFLLGVLTLAFFWNLPTQGHPFLGGYDRFASSRGFDLRNPFVGMASLLAPLALWILPQWWLVLRSSPRAAARIVGLWFPLVVFLGLLPNPEGERRTAPLVVASIAACLAQRGLLAKVPVPGLCLIALVSGLHGLGSDFAAFTQTPLGLFSGPHLLFLKLAFEEGQPWIAGAAIAFLLAAATLAASRTLRLMAASERPVGSNGGPPPESGS
jgi:hypothetical protein